MRQISRKCAKHLCVQPNTARLLTIYRALEPQAEVQRSQRQQTFLETAQPGGAHKTSDYAEMTGVVVRLAQRELSELLELGFLQRCPFGKRA